MHDGWVVAGDIDDIDCLWIFPPGFGHGFANVYDVPKLPEKLRDALPIAFAVLVVAVVFILTWKWERGDFDSPNKEGTSSSQESEQSQEVEQPPVMPKDAKRNDILGVQTFVTHYFDVSNYVQRTGDVAALEKLIDLEACPNCQKILDQLTNNTSEGRYMRGGDYELIEVFPNVLGQTYAVVTYDRSVARVFNKDGSEAAPAAEAVKGARGIVDVNRHGDKWLVAGIRPTE